jgi:uncharacterized membrane protein
MNLQDTYYILSIIFMSLSLLILIGIVILVFYIKKKVTNIHDEIQSKLDDINDYGVKPVKKAIDIASSFFGARSRKSKSRK